MKPNQQKNIQNQIFSVRGVQVMLDSHLATKITKLEVPNWNFKIKS